MYQYLDLWKTLVAADNIPAALIQHFDYLVDDPRFHPMLKNLMGEAETISYTEDRLTIQFRNRKTCIHAYAPLETPPEHYPATFRQILKHHRLIEFDPYYIALGEHHNFNDDDGWYDAIRCSVLAEWVKPEQLVCPLWDYSDCWLYHPLEKNVSGEPTLYYLSHEGGDIHDPTPYNPGTLFLKRCLQELGLPVVPPSFPTELCKEWYENLDEPWKQLLADNLKISNADDAANITTIRELHIPESSGITSLAPIAFLQKLEELYCDAPGITDLSPLQQLPQLIRLRISSKKVRDFSPLRQLFSLQHLILSNSSITELAELSDMVMLKSLDLENTAISDITPLTTCKRLERLDLSRTKLTDGWPLTLLPELHSLYISGTPLKYFIFLDSLKKLQYLKANNTALNFFPYQCTGVLSIDCKNTAIPFEEYIRYRSFLLRIKKHPKLGPTINSDFNISDINFITELEGIRFSITDLGDMLTILTNDQLIHILKHNPDKLLTDRLMQAWLALDIQGGKINYREELAGNALVGVIFGHIGEETTKEIFRQLIPENIQLPRLGYNLACYYASQCNKTQLFRYTKFALENGYAVEKFKTDDDFINYREDEEFLAFLSSFEK